MCELIWTDIKWLLRTWPLAACLPLAILAAAPEEKDLALAGLGLGCACLAAKAFSRGLPQVATKNERDRQRRWAIRMFTVLLAALGAAGVFFFFGVDTRDYSGLPVSLLAMFTLVPGLGVVPYLTVRTRKPFAAVVLGTFLVCLIKLASCLVVRMVYGPDALADGYMAGDWQTAKLMISLFWIGTVTLSIVLAFACHRRLTVNPVSVTA